MKNKKRTELPGPPLTDLMKKRIPSPPFSKTPVIPGLTNRQAMETVVDHIKLLMVAFGDLKPEAVARLPPLDYDHGESLNKWIDDALVKSGLVDKWSFNPRVRKIVIPGKHKKTTGLSKQTVQVFAAEVLLDQGLVDRDEVFTGTLKPRLVRLLCCHPKYDDNGILKDICSAFPTNRIISDIADNCATTHRCTALEDAGADRRTINKTNSIANHVMVQWKGVEHGCPFCALKSPCIRTVPETVHDLVCESRNSDEGKRAMAFGLHTYCIARDKRYEGVPTTYKLDQGDRADFVQHIEQQ